MEHTIETGTFITPRGVELKASYRLKTNDKDCLTACIVEDAYMFSKIFPELPAPMVRSHVSDVAIDLGAHIGGPSLILAAVGFTVHAVEVLPQNVELLRANIAMNEFKGEVIVHAAGISCCDGNQIPCHYGDTTTPSGVMHQFMGSTREENDPNRKEVMVPTVSLPGIFARHKIDRCTILKTDCEGAEWYAFKYMTDDILDRIDWIVGELHNGPLSKLMFLLHDKFENVAADYGVDIPAHILLRRKGV